MRNRNVRRIIIVQFVFVAALVVAHSINAFVEDSLVTITSDSVASFAPAQRGGVASETSIQFAERIRTSGLFLLPDAAIASPGIPGGNGTGRATTPALDVSTKLRLLGTIVSDGEGGAVVIEEIASKRQSLFHLHEMIPDIGEIRAIRRDGVVIRVGDQETRLPPAVMQSEQGHVATAAVQPAAPPSPTPPKRTLDRREVKQAFSDPAKLMTQAQAVPVLANGSLQGFQLVYLAPGSFFQKAGFRYGDVLERINGVEIRDPGRLFTLFSQVVDERTVKVDLLRAGQKTTFTYELR